MSLDINLTNVESTTNKKTTLTDNSDTFYPTQKAVKTAVDLKVDKIAGKGLSTEDYTTAEKSKLAGIQAGAEVNVNADWNATSGDAQILNKPTIPSVTGLVPYTGATGDVDLGNNDLNAEGIKIKGTAGNGHLGLKHQSSGATASGNESVIYADNSGNPKWKNDGNAVQNLMLENSAITGATKTKITYDAKGLVTSGADATTADIADSSNKRYVTDANLTVLGNTSNTNTGDETQSSILSKLGFWQYNRVAETSAVTGTIVETIIENITIPANTYLSGGILRLYNLKVRKVGAVGVTTAMKIYIGPNSNNLSGATQIGVLSSSLFAGSLFFEMLRTFTCTTSNLLGFPFSASSNTDTIISTIARGSVAVDWTIPQYIIITIQAASVSDSYTLIGASAKNF